MPLLSHRRLLLLFVLGFAALLLVIQFQHDGHSEGGFSFIKQYFSSSKVPVTIANTTLGVRVASVLTSIVLYHRLTSSSSSKRSS